MMKQESRIKNCRYAVKRFITACTLVFALLPGITLAQADTTKKPEPAAAEEPELIAPALNFLTVQKGDNTIDLKAALTAKLKGSVIKLRYLRISFVQVVGDAEKELGSVVTDGFGKAVLNIKTDSLQADQEGKINFKASFAGNKHMDPADAEMSIKRARLHITPVKEDSALSVQIKLVDIASGKEIPVPETLVGIYVHRSFKPQKIGEGTTDENGEATVEVPANLPGDVKGNIILLAKLDENETYGNLESAVAQKWGIPVSDKVNELPRALWSAHPPYWMMITFIVLMSTVWGHYLVILFQLFRLRKEEPAPDSPLVEHLSS